MKYINPFYIELQETIVGKYLNIIHTYTYKTDEHYFNE